MTQTSFLTNPYEATRIAQLLQERSEVPKPLTLSELLAKAKSSITQMLKNGHTYQDVVTVLASFEVITNESEVEACHTGVDSLKRKRGKGKKKKSHLDLEAMSENLIEFSLAAQICQELAKQAEIRKGLTKEELVGQLREPIAQMLGAGYSYEDIAEAISQGGVHIAASTLKTYYNKLERHQEAKQNQENASSRQPSVKAQFFEPSGQPGEISDTILQKKPQNSKRLKEAVIVPENELEKEFNL